MNSRFSCMTTRVEGFSLDLPRNKNIGNVLWNWDVGGVGKCGKTMRPWNL